MDVVSIRLLLTRESEVDSTKFTRAFQCLIQSLSISNRPTHSELRGIFDSLNIRKVIEVISPDMFVGMVVSVFALGEGEALISLLRKEPISNFLKNYFIDSALLRPECLSLDLVLIKFTSEIPEYLTQPELVKTFIIIACQNLQEETKKLPDSLDDVIGCCFQGNFVFDVSLEILCNIVKVLFNINL